MLIDEKTGKKRSKTVDDPGILRRFMSMFRYSLTKDDALKKDYDRSGKRFTTEREKPKSILKPGVAGTYRSQSDIEFEVNHES